jgi:hypothetical protein
MEGINFWIDLTNLQLFCQTKYENTEKTNTTLTPTTLHLI